MTPPIAIIGAGPCGLQLAALLERNKIDYVVYERDPPSAPSQHKVAGVGGSLDIHPGTGLRALEAAGLLDEFKKHARYDATGFVLATSDGEIKARVGEDREAPEIDRHQLRRLLLDSVPPEKIQWEHGVKAVEKAEGDSWSIKFTNGNKSEPFRLVVGADGAWSKVRPALTSAKPIYTGAHYIEGRLSPTNPSYPAAQAYCGKGLSAALGARKAIIVQQMADTSYRVYMGLQSAEDFISSDSGGDLIATTEKLRREFVEEDKYFAGWAEMFKQFIRDAEGPFRPWSLYTLPLEGAKWERVKGVTLLGDAAHLSPPNGEGVNSAMYDALVLSEKIAEFGVEGEGLEKAVQVYEEDMFPRAKEHIEDGNQMLERMLGEHAAEEFLAMVTQGEEAQQ